MRATLPGGRAPQRPRSPEAACQRGTRRAAEQAQARSGSVTVLWATPAPHLCSCPDFLIFNHLPTFKNHGLSFIIYTHAQYETVLISGNPSGAARSCARSALCVAAAPHPGLATVPASGRRAGGALLTRSAVDALVRASRTHQSFPIELPGGFERCQIVFQSESST